MGEVYSAAYTFPEAFFMPQGMVLISISNTVFNMAAARSQNRGQ